MSQAETVTSTIAPAPQASQSPLDPIVHKAGEALLALRMTKIGRWSHFGYDADENDASSLIDDLDAIVHIIDPIILAIGEYASEHFRGIDLSLFTHQLRDALDGNATHELTSAADAAVQERMDEAA